MQILQGHAVGGVPGTADAQGQCRPLVQRTGQLYQLLALGRGQAPRTGFEGDAIELFVAAAEQGAERAEGRGDDLGQHIGDDLPDNAAEAELRIVEAAGDRQAEVDAAVGIFQQRDGEVQRQVFRTRAFDTVAEHQLVDHHLVLALQLALLDVVFQVERELAGIDAAPGEGGRVGCQARHFEVAENQLDLGEAGRIEGIDLADGARQAVVVNLAVEFQLARRAGTRRQAGDGPAQLVNAGGEGEEQRFVGEVEVAVAEAQAVDVDQEGGRRLGLGRWWRG